jgi:hypothetical protein
MTQEIWKPIVGFEGRYEISNFGNVKSLLRHKILKPLKNANGYLFVSLFKNNHSKNAKIHRLVAEHFLTNYEAKPEVNHKNGVKTDNAHTNLEWTTKSENCLHKSRTLEIGGKPVFLCYGDIRLKFSSVTLAAKYLKISTQSIYYSIRNQRPCGGMDIEYI